MTKTMTLILAAALLVSLTPALAGDHSLDGRWTGVVFAPEGEIEFSMSFATVEGELTATLDSPPLGIVALPVESVSQDGNAVQWIVPTPDAPTDCNGEIGEDGQTIRGTVVQQGVSADFELARAGD